VIPINTSINIAGITFKNPIMPASGTFGSGQEYSEFVDLNQLGAVVTKGVSLTPWEGNPAPRIMETSSGMINAVGLQNPGIDVFIERDIPFLQKFDTNNPFVMPEIISELSKYMEENNIETLEEIRGIVG
jgi:dihydroorotate dehydrogenase (NAD+) catalytic subunit